MSPCTTFLYTRITFSFRISSPDFLRPSAVSAEVSSSPECSSSLGRKAPACAKYTQLWLDGARTSTIGATVILVGEQCTSGILSDCPSGSMSSHVLWNLLDCCMSSMNWSSHAVPAKQKAQSKDQPVTLAHPKPPWYTQP